jgi:hypothetical protein
LIGAQRIASFRIARKYRYRHFGSTFADLPSLASAALLAEAKALPGSALIDLAWVTWFFMAKGMAS